MISFAGKNPKLTTTPIRWANEANPQWCGLGRLGPSHHDPTPGAVNCCWEGTRNLQLLPEEWRDQIPHQVPQLLKPIPERQALKNLALKTNWAHTQDMKMTFKGLTPSDSQPQGPARGAQTWCEGGSCAHVKALAWVTGIYFHTHPGVWRVLSGNGGWQVPSLHPCLANQSLPERSWYLPLVPWVLWRPPVNTSWSPGSSGQQGIYS